MHISNILLFKPEANKHFNQNNNQTNNEEDLKM